MEKNNQQASGSDDEDDLESLRLAALQSLKKPAQTATSVASALSMPPTSNKSSFNNSQGLGKRKNFHGGQHRNRPGQFNRTRNTNLISIPTVGSEKSSDVETSNVNKNISKFNKTSDVPKLVLPQDRYCNTNPTNETKSSEATTKFNRYDNSDDSESESEIEENSDVSESESPKKLERTSSLEALMQELENEIQGEAKIIKSEEKTAKCKSKTKKNRKTKECELDNNDVQNETEVKKEDDTEKCTVDDKAVIINEEVDTKIESKPLVAKLASPNSRPTSPVVEVKSPNVPKRPVEARTRPPKNHKFGRDRPSHRRPMDYHHPQMNAYPNPNIPFIPQPIPYQNVPFGPVMPLNPYPSYDYLHSGDSRSPPRKIYSPNRFDRPLSPLSLNTDIYTTITAAPLSPRSAAFVLQNREIIERRKKSPRRSYSRSPSPHFRRSSSPKYRRSLSRSPRNSLSPRRLSPVNSRGTSPRQRYSPLRRVSPGRLRVSPVNKRYSPLNLSPKRASPSRRKLSPRRSPSPKRLSPLLHRKSPVPKSSVRERLGMRSYQTQPKTEAASIEVERKSRKRSRSSSLSLSPSPERSRSPQNNGEKNDILEARRRKFEMSGVIATEGIIRLKPKDSITGDVDYEQVDSDSAVQDPNTNEEIMNEDELLEGDEYIDLNAKVDDLFSDEESDNEAEGRFKSNTQSTSRNVSILPFTKLLSGSNCKNDVLPRDKNEYRRGRDRRDITRDRNVSSRNRNNDKIRSEKLLDKNKVVTERIRIRTVDHNRKRSRSPLRNYNEKATYEKGKDIVVDLNLEKVDDQLDDNKEKNKNVSSRNVEHTSKDSVKKPEIRTVKQRINLRNNSKAEKRRASTSLENKKIEIKIRNPSKYEVEGRNYDVLNENEIEEMDKRQKNTVRKVEVTSDAKNNDKEEIDEPEPEIIIDNEEDFDDLSNKNNGGDLRAQLSRKRAERQRMPVGEEVPKRLLQTALQGAVFKKSKKSKSKKKSHDAAPKDSMENDTKAAVKRITNIAAEVTQVVINSTKAVNGLDCNVNATRIARKVQILHSDTIIQTPASDTKIPIHLRLGLANNSDIFSDTSNKKMNRNRLKNHDLEQV